MHRKVLCTRCRFQIFLIIPLHSSDIGCSQSSCQIRILSISFMPPSPARVPEDIYIWCIKGKSLVNTSVPIFLLHIIFRPCLCRYGIRYLIHKFLIKGSCQCYRLRKYSSYPCPCNPMKGFIPPVILCYAKPLDSLCLMHHL